MNIKDAVFKKHISLLAAGIRSDYFDDKPQYFEFRPTRMTLLILSTWPR